MKAVMRRGPGKAALVDRDIPVPGADEVIIRTAFTGICGSDAHRFTEDLPRWDTLVLGHEFSGTLESLGGDVRGFRAGDRVTAAPLIPCHTCEYCARGEFSLCPSYSFVGSRRDGSFAEFLRVPARNLVSLGDDFDLARGAFVEPLTVVLHPVMRLGSLLGKTAVVTGLGTIGLLAVQVFRAAGAQTIVAGDIVPEKLTMAADLGADRTVNTSTEDLEDLLGSLGGAHVVFESSGANPAKLSALRIARGRGTVLLVGTSPRDITFEAALFERITRKELTITGSWMNYSAPWPGEEWRTAVRMLKTGLVDTASLVTHRYPLHRFQDALDTILGSEDKGRKEAGGPVVKVMITADGDNP